MYVCMHLYISVCVYMCMDTWTFLYRHSNFQRDGHQIQHKVCCIPSPSRGVRGRTPLFTSPPSPAGGIVVTDLVRDYCLKRGNAHFLTCQHFLNVTDSLENGKSVKEPPALNFSQSRTPLWPIETQTDPGAKRTRWDSGSHEELVHDKLEQGHCAKSWWETRVSCVCLFF